MIYMWIFGYFIKLNLSSCKLIISNINTIQWLQILHYEVPRSVSIGTRFLHETDYTSIFYPFSTVQHFQKLPFKCRFCAWNSSNRKMLKFWRKLALYGIHLIQYFNHCKIYCIEIMNEINKFDKRKLKYLY